MKEHVAVVGTNVFPTVRAVSRRRRSWWIFRVPLAHVVVVLLTGGWSPLAIRVSERGARARVVVCVRPVVVGHRPAVRPAPRGLGFLQPQPHHVRLQVREDDTEVFLDDIPDGDEVDVGSHLSAVLLSLAESDV